MSRLTLTLPSLLSPDQCLAAMHAAAPNLDRLLRRGWPSPPEPSLTGLCCRFLGLGTGSAPPVAPLTARADGLDGASGYWLRLDPGYLEPGMGGLIFTPASHLGLRTDEAHGLAETVRGAWEQDQAGGRLLSPVPGRWYVHLGTEPDLDTTPLDHIGSDYLTPHLPRGTDALAWMRRVNDAQMHLHDHPVNRARETAGLAPINGLWLWGGGRLPKLPDTPGVILGGDDEIQALAQGAGAATSPLPESVSGIPMGPALAILPALTDGYGLAEELAQLDRQWFKPLLSALRRGRLTRLELHAAGRSVTLNPAAVWQFWR
ncbi:MAG TPA: hypothetical protein PLQ64_13015 [Thiobacillaceae bacterium]|nr:hypothetical protein [Thiobacillaceae bacterium]